MKILLVAGAAGTPGKAQSDDWEMAAAGGIRRLGVVNSEFRVLVRPGDERDMVHGVRTISGTTDRAGLLSVQQRYPFGGILMAHRERAVESVARKLGVACVAIRPAPLPLDVWVLDSAWHDNRLRSLLRQEVCTESWEGEDLLCLLPKTERYYARFEPLLGRHSEIMYDGRVRKILVPVSRDLVLACERRYGVGVREWLAGLPRKRDVRYIVLPMGDAPLFPEDTHWLRPDVLRLGTGVCRSRLLPLMDKADAVLVTDTVAAVMPLFMGKLCLTDPDLASGAAALMPRVSGWVEDWDGNGFSCLRPALITFLLELGLVPANSAFLDPLHATWSEDRVMQLSSVQDWFSRASVSWEERRACPTKRSVAYKRLRKLFRDPGMYCRDSRFRILNGLGSFL